MNSLNILIVGTIFTILWTVIYQTLKQSQIFGRTICIILSICVSILATIALNSHFKDSIGVLLLPYAAMAIAILAVLLFAFLSTFFKRAKNCSSEYTTGKDDDAQTDDNRLKRLQNDRKE